MQQLAGCTNCRSAIQLHGLSAIRRSDRPNSLPDVSHYRKLENCRFFDLGVTHQGVQINNSAAIITYDPLPRFMVSATDLHQILQNLLSNSLKYSKPGEPPIIHVTATIHGSTLECSVTDNGQGILPQYHEQIFEPFKRLHTRQVPGSGLGLAICKRLVERHGGSISVAPAPAGGTTFTFTLRQ